MTGRVVIVTGGSSGIGRATARLFAHQGCRVYEFSRSGADFEGVQHVTCDVTDESAVLAAVDAVAAREGRIDVLVNNAGFGISGPVESATVEDAKRLYDVNFFGAVRCIRAAIPHMRERGGGHIVLLSSVAATAALPFQAYYSCTKSSVNSLACALRNELGRFGIRVCAVMPGDIRTGFTDAREKDEAMDETYGGSVKRAVASMEKDERGGMAPEAVAKVIVRAAGKKNPRPLYAVGAKYKVFSALLKLLPVRLSNWIIGKMYR